MITNEDITELFKRINALHRELITSKHKTSVEVLSLIDNVGERLASHFTGRGFKVFYRLPDSNEQVISIDVNLNAKKEYEKEKENGINPDFL